MSFLTDFEARIGSVFGAAPQGYTEPFSFKKLAKRAAREMENETYEIDGVDTAPALYTVLVSASDDSLMRPLYEQITYETSSFVTAQAQKKGYAFVGSPLVRFMVDPSLKSGKFAVFAENVDAGTLARLREEERAFLAGGSSAGGAAAQAHARSSRVRPTSRGTQAPAQVQAPAPAPLATPVATPLGGSHAPAPVPTPAHAAAPASLDPLGSSAGDGLDVIPDGFFDAEPEPVASASESTPMPVAMAASAPVVVPGKGPGAAPVPAPEPIPQTQLRNVPLVDKHRGVGVPTSAPASAAARPATCLLVDRQTGQTYTATAPSTIVGRERSQAGIVLRDPNVSRRHAELSFDGRDWAIRDLNSTNGTLVNDVDVTSCVLRDGDLITLGLVNLEFRENPR